jgi:hypothetical protein
MSNVLSNSFEPLFPSITGPGVSPRGKNHPSFVVLHQSVEDGRVLDFEQWKFHMMDENYKAQEALAALPEQEEEEEDKQSKRAEEKGNNKSSTKHGKKTGEKEKGEEEERREVLNEEETNKYFYLGQWDRHSGILKSWKVLSGKKTIS